MHNRIDLAGPLGASRRPGLLDDRHRRSRRRAISVQPPLCHVQQERLRGGHPAFCASLLDRHHLAKDGVVRRPVVTSSRTAFRVAALAPNEARRHRRSAVSHLVAAVLRSLGAQGFAPAGQRRVSASCVHRSRSRPCGSGSPPVDASARPCSRHTPPLDALRRAARHRHPAIDRHIDVGRVDVDAAEAASTALRGDQRRA